MIIWIIVGIAVVSIVLSLRSLKNENGKKEITSTKKELEKGKVLYKSHSSSS
ncbi:MAG: hypothetical protein UT87_C0015G0016 [Candidatus Levybacteria bacterium GW2011_GWC1_40_19]|nr:MAG: hypothetical protein UT44_C0010G0017 [Candidatus Levybacteria bacterium GW2011_GWA1_39_32]KKR50609.1 MAG: hypothetical protein UT87_C0015G0016 [Candidatus Levybacteria bacterium GW2011_GWC1_40_19]KKR73488.1 MAG: hypothetical protein UU15_C0009G0010 [Candidatus Levybacteria bacterium GW2011_GWC2_40_7]KKR94690.1 MAG: hypothetical protein UU45_C0008G0090 [Candidatus Levybacteria bacterium GW2011_GWA2_41_15]KKS01735.1 MAG: hypothetical protein UU52_C0008G0016 [Candidatus Levybacteria bacter